MGIDDHVPRANCGGRWRDANPEMDILRTSGDFRFSSQSKSRATALRSPLGATSRCKQAQQEKLIRSPRRRWRAATVELQIERLGSFEVDY
jgi:hypothetical protein